MNQRLPDDKGSLSLADVIEGVYEKYPHLKPERIISLDDNAMNHLEEYFYTLYDWFQHSEHLGKIFHVRMTIDSWSDFYRSHHPRASMNEVLDSYELEDLFLFQCSSLQFIIYSIYSTLYTFVDEYLKQNIRKGDLESKPSSAYTNNLKRILAFSALDLETMAACINEIFYPYITTSDLVSSDYKNEIAQFVIDTLSIRLVSVLENSFESDEIKSILTTVINNRSKIELIYNEFSPDRGN